MLITFLGNSYTEVLQSFQTIMLSKREFMEVPSSCLRPGAASSITTDNKRKKQIVFMIDTLSVRHCCEEGRKKKHSISKVTV